MANNPHQSNTQISAMIPNANNGKLIIYSGTQPANADASASGSTALATLTLSSPSFTASGGVLTAEPITSATATATGTADWFRITESDGATGLWDGACGTSGSDLNLSTTAISSGATVSVSSLTITYTL